MLKITPPIIRGLKDNEIFVFGSNLEGRHGKGAALCAKSWGAKQGQAIGLMGRTYGIATKGYSLEILGLREIKIQIDKFIEYAKEHPEKNFLVTPIGCGLAGYSPKDVAPFFDKPIPNNIFLPMDFWKVILIQ